VEGRGSGRGLGRGRRLGRSRQARAIFGTVKQASGMHVLGFSHVLYGFP
jgi:hypothetical protein